MIFGKRPLSPETRFVHSGTEDPRAKSPFLPSLDLISMEDIEILIEFEKEFSIAVSDEDAESIKTVGQLIQYVKGRI